jgi:hypothetical protein
MSATDEQLSTHERRGEPPIAPFDQTVGPAELSTSPHHGERDTAERDPGVHGTSRKKKLIVCCDGTMNSDIKGQPITNVARFARCVMPTDREGVPQVVLYQKGIGTGTSKWANTIEGATGRGLCASNPNSSTSFPNCDNRAP